MTRLGNWRSRHWLLAGAIAIVVFCLGATLDKQTFFACWLAAWWTCAGAVLGSQANLWLHDLTGGAWGLPLRPIWRRSTAALPMLLALMLPLLIASWTFYPWAEPGWSPQTQQPVFKALWLSPAFVTARLIVYAVLWQAIALMSARREAYWIAQEAPGSRQALPADSTSRLYGHPHPGKRRKGGSALGLIVYGLTVSLASVDLVLSLMPQWYSSGFGLIAVAMQMKLGFALGVVGASAAGAPRTTQELRDEGNLLANSTPAAAPFPAELGRDWGNLMLMYVLMWAYVAFVQFLIIWAENLPNEIAWYVPRLQTGWVWLGVVLVAVGLFVPLFLLLFRAVKQSRRRLRAVAVALCVLGWLESIWVTLPSVAGLTWHAVWMAPLALAGMAALLWAMSMSGEYRTSGRKLPSVPVRESD